MSASGDGEVSHPIFRSLTLTSDLVSRIGIESGINEGCPSKSWTFVIK